jgi:hypothetical protein
VEGECNDSRTYTGWKGVSRLSVRCIVRSMKNDISITSEMMSPGDCASRSDIAARNSVRTPHDACALRDAIAQRRMMRAHSVMPLRSYVTPLQLTSRLTVTALSL